MTDRKTRALAWAEVESPLGTWVVVASADGATHVQTAGSPALPELGTHARGADPIACEHALRTAERLRRYFDGEKDPWEDLTLSPHGTAFQQRVWDALRRIPYGSTTSYRGLANAVGRPRAARAIGQANHRNPLAIVVPCHRVVAADGSLGGYAGGLDRKRWLLAHEGARSA